MLDSNESCEQKQATYCYYVHDKYKIVFHLMGVNTCSDVTNTLQKHKCKYRL